MATCIVPAALRARLFLAYVQPWKLASPFVDLTLRGPKLGWVTTTAVSLVGAAFVPPWWRDVGWPTTGMMLMTLELCLAGLLFVRSPRTNRPSDHLSATSTTSESWTRVHTSRYKML